MQVIKYIKGACLHNLPSKAVCRQSVLVSRELKENEQDEIDLPDVQQVLHNRSVGPLPFHALTFQRVAVFFAPFCWLSLPVSPSSVTTPMQVPTWLSKQQCLILPSSCSLYSFQLYSGLLGLRCFMLFFYVLKTSESPVLKVHQTQNVFQLGLGKDTRLNGPHTGCKTNKGEYIYSHLSVSIFHQSKLNGDASTRLSWWLWPVGTLSTPVSLLCIKWAAHQNEDPVTLKIILRSTISRGLTAGWLKGQGVK